MTALKFGIITLFPDMFSSLEYGVIGRALNQKLIEISTFNPRDFTTDSHHTVDDRPYGGGPGMVMKFEPLHDAIAAAKSKLGADTKVVLLSPQGKRLNQQLIAEQTTQQNLILVAGRYEGIDERLIAATIDEEWSVGDYVVSGGELPAMLCIDAITRLLPGALGHEDSAAEDSFVAGLLDYPHYTRPDVIANQSVPQVLLSGDHAAIATWRQQQALGRTWQRRQDLLKRRTLTEREQHLLDEYIRENAENTINTPTKRDE
jgi:tRNA (guanine37-N1)-methyltransferase